MAIPKNSSSEVVAYEGLLMPKTAKELAKILGGDPDLRRAVHGVIARADLMVEREILAAVRESARRSEVSLRLLSHEAATDGLKRYYKDIRAAGKFVKLW